MAGRTRSSASSSPVKIQSTTKTADVHKDSVPLRVFILPKSTSPAARILLLKHPSEGTKKRFFFSPSDGLFEFKILNSPATCPRSILFTGPNSGLQNQTVEPSDLTVEQTGAKVESVSERATGTKGVASGYVNKAAETFVATPFDMAFILMPLLSSQGSSTKAHAGKARLQPLDDILDPYLEDDKHLRFLFENGRLMLESAAAKICDTVQAGNEMMFRMNEDKVFKLILDKAQNAAKSSFPASMEEKFVGRALEKPIRSMKREDNSFSTTTEAPSVDSLEGSFGANDSLSSTFGSGTSTLASEVSSTTLVAGEDDEAIPDEIIRLQRLRTAWSFITLSYVPDHLADRLTRQLSSTQCPVDFAPLETYLSQLTNLRAEALASRSFSSFGQKRGLEDEDASNVRAEKKRKQEEAEKRKKAGESRGLRDLKKVDVSGMKKMSAFFSQTSTTKVKS